MRFWNQTTVLKCERMIDKKEAEKWGFITAKQLIVSALCSTVVGQESKARRAPPPPGLRPPPPERSGYASGEGCGLLLRRPNENNQQVMSMNRRNRRRWGGIRGLIHNSKASQRYERGRRIRLHYTSVASALHHPPGWFVFESLIRSLSLPGWLWLISASDKSLSFSASSSAPSHTPLWRSRLDEPLFVSRLHVSVRHHKWGYYEHLTLSWGPSPHVHVKMSPHTKRGACALPYTHTHSWLLVCLTYFISVGFSNGGSERAVLSGCIWFAFLLCHWQMAPEVEGTALCPPSAQGHVRCKRAQARLLSFGLHTLPVTSTASF